MSTLKLDWPHITKLGDEQLKQAVFDLLQAVSRQIYSGTGEDPAIQEAVPRLADLLDSRKALASFRQPFNALARAAGLWNYIDKESAAAPELLIAETVTIPELGGITLHREQVAALNTLLDGRNLILSAPTSFGKSLLIDALLATGRYNRVAIVLPTIALLDEFRRRLTRRFRDKFTLVMHPTDDAPNSPTIFLGTQERLINRGDLGRLDLTVVDEFYKLDPNRRDDRSITLNAAVYKLLSRSQQFFFLGPNIDGVQVSGEGRWKFEFLRTTFATVVLDVVCEVKKASDFGAYTASQLTYFINSLRISKTFQAFLADYDSKYQGQPHTHDNVFRFLRSCEYGLSQAIAVVELFVKQARPDADYSVFLHGLSRWFLPDELKNLDEEGIPVQISERFWRFGDSRRSLLSRIERATREGELLSSFEQRWLRAALELEA